jgi:hypothetical protein
MQKMITFFHMGPIVAIEDFEAYRKCDLLILGYQFNSLSDPPTAHDSTPGIPPLQARSWAWPQPFDEQSSSDLSYRTLGLGNMDSRPKYPPDPCTAIESSLQLKEPILRRHINGK